MPQLQPFSIIVSLDVPCTQRLLILYMNSPHQIYIYIYIQIQNYHHLWCIICNDNYRVYIKKKAQNYIGCQIHKKEQELERTENCEFQRSKRIVQMNYNGKRRKSMEKFKNQQKHL